VGDAREVRVFDVNNVKGMEFEAVFFIGIDDLRVNRVCTWTLFLSIL
jgi:hypothetical protein